MKKTGLSLLLLLFIIIGRSQNFVLNPGFEQFHCSPWSISSLEDCNNWSNPTMNSPDYFNNDCKENKTSAIPDYNWWGYQLPKSGNSYVGFIGYRPADKPEESLTEYVEAEFTSPLKANETYNVKLNVSLAECSSLALKNLGIYFSENKVKEKTVQFLKLKPQVVSHIEITDTVNWINIEEKYTAKGNEKYMTIGCFNTGEKIKYKKVEHSNAIKDPRGEAYYFIDDVSVQPVMAVLAQIIQKDSNSIVIPEVKKIIPNDSKAEIQVSVVLKNIFFETGKYELLSESITELDVIFKSLNRNDSIEIEINGHADSRGKKEANVLLSENRAGVVFNYFETKGIHAEQMSTHGFGDTKPVASNRTNEGRTQNRRVEIAIKSTHITIPDPPKQIASLPGSIANLEIGKTMVLKNLNFEGGTADLLPEAKPALEELLKTMKDNPNLEIEIDGHVCCYNDMPLSVLRAQAVYKYLIKNGIAASRMTYKGFSRNNPIVEDDRYEENARLNRRVEIKILKK